MPARDLKKYPMWFLGFSHSYPAWTPLFHWTWDYPLAHGLTYAVNETWLPTIRGSEVRNIDGCSAAGALRISDEARNPISGYPGFRIEGTAQAVASAGDALRENRLPRLTRWSEACKRCDQAGICRNRP
ncbi:unnamed protein product [marine sediment metagenome]|uniref:Uncharacterized protein n=1 Tax=marine sediment metagenome TaxID=412755 RepID=X1LMH7_9ZZZZ